jgi:hypothetical protein
MSSKKTGVMLLPPDYDEFEWEVVVREENKKEKRFKCYEYEHARELAVKMAHELGVVAGFPSRDGEIRDVLPKEPDLQAAKPVVTLVDSYDWQGLYIDGVLKYEANQIELLDFIHLSGVDCVVKRADEDWIGRERRFKKLLSDVKFSSDSQSETSMQMVDGHPRRWRLELNTPAELAIREAMLAVEGMEAHPLLTEAISLLDKARNKVADFVELNDKS